MLYFAIPALELAIGLWYASTRAAEGDVEILTSDLEVTLKFQTCTYANETGNPDA